jgi:hypothetical protein
LRDGSLLGVIYGIKGTRHRRFISACMRLALRRFDVFLITRRRIALIADLKPSRICLHGGDYEEYRLLGYKNPVRTSQEAHYVSNTESSHLMLCKI